MPRLHRQPALVAGVFLLALASCLGGRPACAADTTPAAAVLAERHTQWLEEVDVILSAEERNAFLLLTRDYQRDAFIDRFWREHDVDSLAGYNAFREHWQEKVSVARELFGKLTDARARYFLLHGPPDPRTLIYCRRREAQIEIWLYPRGSDAERMPFPLLFYRPYGSAADFRLWEPGDEDELYGACEPDSLGIDDQFALRQAFQLKSQNWTDVQYLELLARARDRPPTSDREWVATFESLSTDLPARAEPLAAALDLRFGGWRQSRRLVEGTVAVAAGDVPATRHFLLNGEVLTGERLFESFRIQYAPPAQPGAIPLAFVRALRPGHYTLVVRIEEPGPGRFFRAVQEFDVPGLPSIAANPADLTELAGEAPGLHLRVPTGLLRGPVRFDAEVRGTGVAAVEFLLDGKRVLLKHSPPWSVELDLGAAARAHHIAASALDGQGEELLRDERWVNTGDYRFAVRLVEPRPGTATRAGAPVRARAEIQIPAGAKLDRLELYLDDALIGTLYGEPWELPLALPKDAALHVLRAAAVLADGGAAEDSVLLNAPAASATVDVRMVEVFARVHSRASRTASAGEVVHGLGCADFRLREDGVEQQLLRCEEAAEGTLHLGVLLDVSASMAGRMGAAKTAADRFLVSVLRPRDRATLVAFNDFTNRLVPFTPDLGALRAGLDGLKAERGTALWDALIRTLQDFSGVEGRRALLLLSDGDDQASSSTFAQAEATVRQSGVLLYSVGLDLPLGASRHRLRRLSEESGGRAFFVHDVSELGTAYAEIAGELRGQYLLAYQPRAGGEKFRSLRVDVRRRGVEVEAPAGYQP